MASMLVTRRILGLDLGSHSVKAVELVQTLRDLAVGQLRAVPVEGGDPLEPARLSSLIRSHALPTDFVVCAVPGDRISTRRLSFPFRDRRRITQAVPFELEGDVPFDLEEFFIDWSPCGGDGKRSEVIAALVPRAEVARLLQGLAAAHLTPRVLEAEGLVLGNLASLFDFPGNRLLVDVGHRKTTLCLLVDGRPAAARTLPLAGRHVTEAIAADRGLQPGEAERLKHEEGVLDPGLGSRTPRALAVLDRLARELARTLGAVEPMLGGAAAARVGGITLLGGGARLHRLDAYLAERTGIPCVPLPLPPEPLRTQILAAGDPALFAPALALALRGGLRARTQMNFRQDEFAHRVDLRQVSREFRSTGILAAITVVLALAVAGSRAFSDSRHADALEGQVGRLYAEVFPGRPAPANMQTAFQQAVRGAEDRADLLGVYRGNLSALDLLTEISGRVPADVEVVFDELTIDRNVVRIGGYTRSFEAVDRLRAELSKFEPFSQIRVSEIKNEARREGKSFSVTISLVESGEAS